jgi:hypothetical protein
MPASLINCKKCLPEFLRRFFFGGEWLRFRKHGGVDDAKKAIWSRLGNPENDEAWIGGIIWADSVHLCWQRQHWRNDFKPVFHGQLRNEGDDVILQGRISASRSSRIFIFGILIVLLGLSVILVQTILVPLMCSLMVGMILLLIRFSQHCSRGDEQEIVRVIQEIFEERLRASRTL